MSLCLTISADFTAGTSSSEVPLCCLEYMLTRLLLMYIPLTKTYPNLSAKNCVLFDLMDKRDMTIQF